jgi:hypothetical protein
VRVEQGSMNFLETPEQALLRESVAAIGARYGVDRHAPEAVDLEGIALVEPDFAAGCATAKIRLVTIAFIDLRHRPFRGTVRCFGTEPLARFAPPRLAEEVGLYAVEENEQAIVEDPFLLGRVTVAWSPYRRRTSSTRFSFLRSPSAAADAPAAPAVGCFPSGAQARQIACFVVRSQIASEPFDSAMPQVAHTAGYRSRSRRRPSLSALSVTATASHLAPVRRSRTRTAGNDPEGRRRRLLRVTTSRGPQPALAEAGERLLRRTDVVPAVDRVEVHPFFTQQALRDFHAANGIVTQAWSPLGGVNRYRPSDADAVKNALEHPTIVELAAKYQKTPAQVVLCWHIEHGVSAIPKSVKPHRIAENIDVFDFALTPDEVTAIDALDTGVRGGPDPELVDTKLYPFRVEN